MRRSPLSNSLSLLLLLAASSIASAAGGANIDAARALNADGDSDWMLHGRTYNEQRFSPLAQVNEDNVTNLGIAWTSPIPSIDDGLAATPIVVDGVIYMTSSFANTWAMDARTGEVLWEYNPVVQYHGSFSTSWAARVNRGAAAWKGNIYVATPDCRLVALDAKTGEEVWSELTCDPSAQYGITGAPRVFKDRVIIGNGVADYGARGYVTAYNAKDGKLIWRFYTVPGDPSKGFENPILEMAAKTWTGEKWWEAGGGTAWDAIVFDPDLNQIYIGTDSALPWDYSVRSPDGGDNLFLNSIIALDADTGRYKWHYQTVPQDAWDFNAASHIIQAELKLFGEPRKVLMQAPNNGFFYVIDRITGELLAAEKFVPANWAEKIDIKTGRPVEAAGVRYYENENKLAHVSPMVLGGHNWHPMSYHPATGLVYIPAHVFSSTYRIDPTGMAIGGTLFDYYGNDLDKIRGAIKAGRVGKIGRLLGWDPVRMEVKWRVDHEVALNGGVLSTAGNLVFQGTGSGEFRAYAADTGKQLWQIDVQRSVQAPPVTYMLDGDQYVLLPTGGGGIARQMAPLFGNRKEDNAAPSTLMAFKLGANGKLEKYETIVRKVPKPPELNSSAEQIALGEAKFNENTCGLCHGGKGVGPRIGSSTPDLRYLSADSHKNWKEIVLKGSRAITGMLPHEDFMSESDAEAIHAFVTSLQRDLYRAQNP